MITRAMTNNYAVSPDAIYIAIRSMDVYCESNTYIPRWEVIRGSWITNQQSWLRIDEVMGMDKLSEGKAYERYYSDKNGKIEYQQIIRGDWAVNVLLVIYKENKNGWNQNHPYGISNVSYYNSHLDEFDGYIDLEDIPIVLRRNNV